MLQQLFCAHCRTALTEPINVETGGYPADREWTGYGCDPLTEPGHAIVSSDPMVWSEDANRKPPLQFAPQYWLNPADVVGRVEDVKNGRRLNGCCGPSGHGGPNQRCVQCKEEVGTLMADCWTDHVFVPEPGQTYWMEMK